MSLNSLSPNSSGSDVELDFSFDDNITVESNPFHQEDAFLYQPGGYHPVHLGDELGPDNRYRIIHKLGEGGSSIVWLARDAKSEDVTKYVALKILLAVEKLKDCTELKMCEVINEKIKVKDKSLCLPLNNFQIHGPNGKHVCIVYPVYGPKASLGVLRNSENSDGVLRRMSLQLMNTVDRLHKVGVCHGDITANNVLHHISELDGLSEDQVLERLGRPQINRLIDMDTLKPHEKKTAPQYMVYKVEWSEVDPQFIRKDLCLIDLGEAYEISQPSEDLGTPPPYRSPELLLESKAGLGSDIWALACVIFEIRTGRKLFNESVFFDIAEEETIADMVKVLGILPEPWWSTTWKERKEYFQDEADEYGQAVSAFKEDYSTVDPMVAPGAKSILDKLSPGAWYEIYNGKWEHRDIPREEQEVFADLLQRLLKFKVEERMPVSDAMNHAWFKL